MIENDNIFWPRKTKIIDILMLTAGGFISWVVWSVVLLSIVFVFSGFVDIPDNFKNASLWFWWSSSLFPFILSIMTFFVSVIVSIITYLFLNIIDNEKYKKTIIHFWQISLFAIIIYILFAPIYIIVGNTHSESILYVFIAHILLLTFGELLILELLNNYRYILLWVYASFFWLGISALLVLGIFSLFSDWYAKLLSILLIIPLINAFILFFKWIFELAYYQYFMISGSDPLGDIFHQIKQEDVDNYTQAESENTTY